MADFIAPEEAENYQRLLSFVGNHEDRGAEVKEALSDVLWMINAPGHLHRFGWVTERLAIWLGQLDTLRSVMPDTRHWDASFLFSLKRWIDWYSHHTSEVKEVMPDDFSVAPASWKRNPMNGRGLQRYGLYSALFCQQEVVEGRAIWNLLALRFLLAHVKLMRIWGKTAYKSYAGKDESPELKIKIYGPSKTLRQLSGVNFSEVICRLTKKEVAGQLSMDDVDASITLAEWMFSYIGDGAGQTRRIFYVDEEQQQRADKAKFSSKVKPLLDKVADLLRFLKSIEDGRFKCREEGGGKSGRNQNLLRGQGFGHGFIAIDEGVAIQYLEIDDDDPLVEEEPISLVTKVLEKPNKKENLKELEKSDLCIDEFEDGDSLSLVDVDCEDTRNNPMSMALAAKGRQKQLMIQAQMFRWGYSNLTLRQLSDLDGWFRKKVNSFEREDALSDQDLFLYECYLIVLTMLWSGSKLSRAVELTVHHKRVLESDSVIGIYAHKENRDKNDFLYEWRFKALEPTYLSWRNVDDSSIRKRNRSFWLPDATGVVEYLVNYREYHQQDKKTGKLFLRPVENYEQEIKSILKEEINTSLVGEGVTLHKIGNFLFQQIVGETGDVTAAAYITGQGHYAANVTIFYTTPSLNTLREIYSRAMHPVISEIVFANKKRLLQIKKAVDDEHVGARHCVTKSGYQYAVAKIKSDLKALADYSDWDEFVAFHNLYTFYLVWMFGFSTAARAIKTPLIRAVDIDDRGLSTLADKDTDPPYHARMVWLSSDVIAQLQDYAEHLKVTTQWLNFKREGKKHKEDGRACYFIREAETIPKSKAPQTEEVSPATLEVFYRQYLNVPANAHRRFLRTELMEQEMPIESVNCLMGHWGQGEEPWGLYSSFNIPAHIDNLKVFLVPLIEELGFEFIPSRLGRVT